MMLRGALLFPVLIFAAVAVLLLLGNYYYDYSWTTFSFPLGVGIAVCVLCAIEITAVLRRHGETAPMGSDIDSADDDTRQPLSWKAGAWMLALAVFLYAFGFVWGTAAYLLVCLRGNGFSWPTSIIVGLASILVTWGLFINILSILLPVQPLWMTPL